MMHRVLAVGLAWFIGLHVVTVSGEGPQYNCTGFAEDPCIASSPENRRIQDLGAQQTAIEDILRSPHQLTENDLKGLCKVHVNVRKCNLQYFLQCYAGTSRSALEGLVDRAIEAANKICNRPDLLPKARVLRDCVVSATRAYQNRTTYDKQRFEKQTSFCTEKLSNPPNALSSLYGPPSSRIPYALIDNETAVLRDVCCAAKRYFTCLPRITLIREACPFEALQVGREIFAELLGPDNYNCAALPNFGCPQGPEAEGPEDYHWTTEIRFGPSDWRN